MALRFVDGDGRDDVGAAGGAGLEVGVGARFAGHQVLARQKEDLGLAGEADPAQLLRLQLLVLLLEPLAGLLRVALFQ
jgi:hypothetical protein